MIYAAYDRQTGERLWYDDNETKLVKFMSKNYSPDEYIIKEYDSFAEMAGLPVLTDEDRQFISEALENGEIQVQSVDDF